MEQILAICLERIMGWRIVSVSPTKQGLVLPLNQQPDAILFNAQLSRQHNLNYVQKQIIRQLKQSPLTQASPIMLLIDAANWMTLQQLESLGVVGAIAKPFNPVTLPKEISELLVIHQKKVD
jgi:CheY-like chemotaxis protein